MLVTDWARETLRVRRDVRDMRKAGWERVDEDGGPLWDLERGFRHDHRIVDVRIAADGRSLWVKTAKVAK